MKSKTSVISNLKFVICLVALLLLAPVIGAAQSKAATVTFAVIGDTGTGDEAQLAVAQQMVKQRARLPFDFVIMLGDNIYEKGEEKYIKSHFEEPYKPLLDAGVKFYASLGNHDETNQRFYANFNMNGNEYYRFKKGAVAFYALNSNYMDKRQVKWLEEELAKDDSPWKIIFFHHPLYSSGKRHGSNTELREVIEPIFLKHRVNAVLAGHEHFYERIKPQKEIYYFVSGAGGKLREGNVKKQSPLTEKAFDTDMSFMIVEVAGDEMHFQVISRTGATVDSGVLMNQRKKSTAAPS